ncbi:MAG: glucosamine inositolphosphorylceramide transferase family protein [Ginsengibacter sp.]
MNFLSKVIDKLYIKQWSIGIADESIEDIIRNKKIGKAFTWAPVNNNFQFYADPFIFKLKNGEYAVLYEEFDYNKQYGYISQFTLNKKNEVISTKTQLETKSHLSYPFIFFENGIMYVFPESSASGKLSCYQYNDNNQTLNFKKDILNLPLLDSTILKHQNKYWIFSTMRDNDSNKKLYIFFFRQFVWPL